MYEQKDKMGVEWVDPMGQNATLPWSTLKKPTMIPMPGYLDPIMSGNNYRSGNGLLFQGVTKVTNDLDKIMKWLISLGHHTLDKYGK